MLSNRHQIKLAFQKGRVQYRENWPQAERTALLLLIGAALTPREPKAVFSQISRLTSELYVQVLGSTVAAAAVEQAQLGFKDGAEGRGRGFGGGRGCGGERAGLLRRRGGAGTDSSSLPTLPTSYLQCFCPAFFAFLLKVECSWYPPQALLST